MTRPHLTLYGQILLWFFLNLALVAAVLVLVLRVQFGVDPRTLLGGRSETQFQAAASLFSTELRDAPRSEWSEIRARYDDAYGVRFAVLDAEGNGVIEGEEVDLPDDLLEALRREPPGPPPPVRRADERERGPGPAPQGSGEGGPLVERPPGRGPLPGADRERPARVVYVGRGDREGHYWAAARVGLANRLHRHPRQAIVVASSPTLGGNQIFYDWRPWLWALAGVLLVSALIWLPFVGRVSRRLRGLSNAAESISEGNFEVEVASERTDELGRLSRAVQRMAGRLDDYMAGQKRFLGDIAHELCSPLARLRMALGVLETRLPPEDHRHLDTLHEEAEALSQLVNELLDFSRASIAPERLPTQEVAVALLLKEVAEREGKGVDIEIEARPDLWITTNRDVLRRALANLVRNANRYAGDDGPIVLRAGAEGDEIVIEVLDRGPGIAEEWIDRVFEPFSRPERARTREGGGAGLGLAIAKTCVEGLGGKIRARNRPGGGLAVEVRICPMVNSSKGS